MKKQQITLLEKRTKKKLVWMRTAFLLLVFTATALQGWAQNAENRQISLEMKNEPLGSALKQFSNVSGYKVNFPSEDVAPYRVTVSIYQMSPFAALQKMLEGKPFEYDVTQNFITVRKVKATSTTASGKFRNVGGQVVDESGDPLPGANVKVLNSPFGAITDAEGNFTCRVPVDVHTLEVSFVGMQSEKVSVKDRNNVRVIMHEDKQQLGDVIVTGYQRISRERSTAAFGFVDSEQLNRQMHSDLASSLEGQVAGLRMNINSNTGDMSPILRGVGTFSHDVGTEPLIVVDDMPTNLRLSEINPYNVESITVLKDAAAASIYGALAANGVIVVATMRAKKEGAHVSINADWFITTKPNFKSLNLASTSDIIDYQTAVFDANVAEKGSAANFLSSFEYNYYNPLFQLYLDHANGDITSGEVNATLRQWRNNDYYKEYRDNAWRTAITQRYNVTVSQKAGNSNHLLSFNYEKDSQRVISGKSNKSRRLFTFSARFARAGIENGPVIAVENYESIEFAPVLLDKAFDLRSAPLGEKRPQLRVGEFLLRYRPEHGKAAVGVAAPGDLRVERYPAAAAGTRSARAVVRGIEMHFEQLGRYLGSINFDAFAESKGVHFSGGDFREGQLPTARHRHVGDLLVPDNAVYLQPLVRGDERFFVAFDVLTRKKRLDYRGAGGRGSEAGVLHRFALSLVFQFFAGRLHCRKQTAFGMQRTRSRLFFRKVTLPHGENIPLGQNGQGRRILLCTLFRLAPYLAPSGARYDRAAHLERDVRTLHTDRGNLF